MSLDYKDIETVVIQLAMLADETRFGHGLPQDEYEDACEEFADKLHGEVYDALANRNPR